MSFAASLRSHPLGSIPQTLPLVLRCSVGSWGLKKKWSQDALEQYDLIVAVPATHLTSTSSNPLCTPPPQQNRQVWFMIRWGEQRIYLNAPCSQVLGLQRYRNTKVFPHIHPNFLSRLPFSFLLPPPSASASKQSKPDLNLQSLWLWSNTSWHWNSNNDQLDVKRKTGEYRVSPNPQYHFQTFESEIYWVKMTSGYPQTTNPSLTHTSNPASELRHKHKITLFFFFFC